MKKVFYMLVVLGFTLQLNAQNITGKWWGMLELPEVKMRIVMGIDSTANGYSAFLLSADQGNLRKDATFFKFEFPNVVLKVSDMQLSIEGKLNTNFTSMNGTFTQGSFSIPIVFTRDSIAPDSRSTVAIKQKYDKREVYITMRDEVKLFTSIYSPRDKSKKYPVIFMRTPYNIEPSGENEYNFFLSVYYRYLEENYIMVFQDVRGRFMSEGTFEDIRPFNPNKKKKTDIDEASDTYDAVDWIVKNVKENNGNVGVMGVSYPGFYSTMAILSNHPAIKAVSPQAPVTDWFIGDDFHHNGAFFFMDAFDFYYTFGRPKKELTRNWPGGFKMPVADNYEFYLKAGSVAELKNKYFGDTIVFWNNVFANPNYNEFWKARTPLQHLKNIRPAVMTVGGWFDAEDLYGALKTYKAIENQNAATHPNYLVMGPWSHGQWSSGEAQKLGDIYWGMDANKSYQQLELDFFNYYLQNKGNGKFNEANIFVTGENKWQTFETWPPKNVTTKTLYFGEKGSLGFEKPTRENVYSEYLSDPNKPVPYAEKVHKDRTREYMLDDQRFASKRPDVLVFETDILQEDITLTGELVANLLVSISGTDADFVVKLIDVFPDTTKQNPEHKTSVPLSGYQMLVRGEIFRGKYRNSFENPEAFEPGKITEVNFTIPDVAHTFKKGHRIMVQVQSSWFPLADRNPQKFMDIYKATSADFQKSDIRVYHNSTHSSGLNVKVLNK